MYATDEPGYIDPARVEELSDGDLIAMVKAGDDTALGILLRRHRDALYRFCLHLTHNRDDAEDVCQESLARAITRVDSLQTGSAFRSWLFSIARNLSIDSHRSRKRIRPLSDDEMTSLPLPFDHENPYDRVETREEYQTVAQALSKLKKNHQTVLMLREVEGLSYADIAVRLDLSQAAVETLLFRARKRLREEYSKTGAPVPAVTILGALRDLLSRLATPFGGTPLAAKIAASALLLGGAVVATPHLIPAAPAIGASAPAGGRIQVSAKAPHASLPAAALPVRHPASAAHRHTIHRGVTHHVTYHTSRAADHAVVPAVRSRHHRATAPEQFRRISGRLSGRHHRATARKHGGSVAGGTGSASPAQGSATVAGTGTTGAGTSSASGKRAGASTHAPVIGSNRRHGSSRSPGTGETVLVVKGNSGRNGGATAGGPGSRGPTGSAGTSRRGASGGSKGGNTPPSGSSTAGGAQQTASNAAGSAQQTVNNTTSAAQQTVNNATNSAQQTASNAAGSAQKTAGSAASGAQQTASNAAGSAQKTASGTAAGAQQTASNATNSAQQAASKAASTATGAANKAVSSAPAPPKAPVKGPVPTPTVPKVPVPTPTVPKIPVP